VSAQVAAGVGTADMFPVSRQSRHPANTPCVDEKDHC
jgi:hypothetical protein